MKYFIDAFKRYADFSGLATRTEYWMFVLMNFVFSMLIVFVPLLVAVPFLGVGSVLLPYILIFIYSAVILIPSLSIAVRRLRDAGKEWYWLFISFVPFVGSIWLIVLLCQPSVAQNTAVQE